MYTAAPFWHIFVLKVDAHFFKKRFAYNFYILRWSLRPVCYCDYNIGPFIGQRRLRATLQSISTVPALSENNVRLAQKMQVRPCIHDCMNATLRLKLAKLLGHLAILVFLASFSHCSTRAGRSPRRR